MRMQALSCKLVGGLSICLLLVSLLIHGVYAQQRVLPPLFDVSSRLNTSWGTWRPAVYFGLRAARPHSPALGLAWTSSLAFSEIRHECRQHDRLPRHGWSLHDGESYGHFVATDHVHEAHIRSSFIAVKHDEVSSYTFSDLVVQGFGAVEMESMRKDKDPRYAMSIYLYALRHPDQHNEDVQTRCSRMGCSIIVRSLSRTTVFVMSRKNHIFDLIIGNLIARKSREHFSVGFLHDNSLRIDNAILMSSSLCTLNGINTGCLRNQKSARANLAIRGITSTDNLHIYYAIAESDKQLSYEDIYHTADSILENIVNRYSRVRTSREVEISNRVRSVFRSTVQYRPMFLYALSNLFGGIGYFHGSSLLVDGTSLPPVTLFSAVPSRPFFPRGFLWDEGFHQLVISRWNLPLSKIMIESWLSTMQPNGWIAREQIHGPEAEAKVTQIDRKYLFQNPSHGNPPTLLLAVEEIFSSYFEKNERQLLPSDDEAFLRRVLPYFERHIEWFVLTHQVPDLHDTFAWTDRLPGHTMTSGLDDYPRTITRNRFELHLDSICWVASSYRALWRLQNVLGNDAAAAKYEDAYRATLRSLYDHYWDEENHRFADHMGIVNGTNLGFSPHIGYVSLFPLLLELVPDNQDSVHLRSLVDAATELLSPCGLRSLSSSDPLYRSNEDYWRGAVWVNLNFLFIRSSLRTYSRISDRIKSLGELVRDRLLDCVAHEYQRTGFIWENYDPDTSRGRGSHPFSGWTSLVAIVRTIQPNPRAE